jgi:CubicO group peptidase (beta-lactamase class C family)
MTIRKEAVAAAARAAALIIAPVLVLGAEIWPTKGWKASVPEEQGVDSQKLAEALDFLKAKEPNIHSLLVIRNGCAVADAYFYPFAPGTRHDVASDTKSVTSTLIGIAIRKGLIKSVEEPLLGFFPGRTIANLDEAKKAITIRDLLSMRSGLQCVEKPTELTLSQMMASPDWVQFMLDRSMSAKPGELFVYNSGAVHLLSAILRRASGRTALDFAKAELFGPLGIADVRWPIDPQSVSQHGWGDLQMRPEDMAKIGYLFLHNGQWDGKTIVSPEWVAEATKPTVPGGEYAYLWWVKSGLGFLARGRGGQYIVVIPKINAIIVTTGGGIKTVDALILNHLVPAFKPAGEKLPPNPTAAALLHEKIKQAGMRPETPMAPVAALPEIAAKIVGRSFVLDPNPFGIGAVTILSADPKEAVLKFGLTGDPDASPSYKLGFDDVARIAPGRYGLPAAGKGAWTNGRTLNAEIDEIGNINKFRIEMTFEGSVLTGSIQELTGLGKVPIRGVMAVQ